MENQSAIVRPVDANPHRSKYGYHVCDYETYCKLKRLHREFWVHVRKCAAWERWMAKTVHRHGNEPSFFHPFGVQKTICRRIPPKIHKNGDVQDYVISRDTDSHVIRRMFLAAKMPHAEPVGLFTIEELRRIDGYYESLNAWQESQRD